MKKHILKVWMILAISFLAMNVAGQSYTAGYPNVSDVTPGSIKVNVAGDFGGSTRWILSEVETGWDNQYVLDNGQVTSMYFFSVSFDVPVDPSKTYYLYLVSSSVFPTAGTVESAPTVIQFNTPAAPAPLTATLNPFDNAIDIPIGTSSFELSFSENIALANGNFYVELLEDGVSKETQSVGISHISNNVLSLSFNYTLQYGKEYNILVPANAIKAATSSALYPGLATGEWSFATLANPVELTLTAPVDGADDVPLSQSLVASFNQNVQLATTASVSIYSYDDDVLVETLIDGAGLSISGTELTVDPTSDFAEGTRYYVIIPDNAIESVSNPGTFFSGTLLKDDWDFTTQNIPPSVVSYDPDGSSAVAIDEVLNLTFDRPIKLNDFEQNSVRIRRYSDGEIFYTYVIDGIDTDDLLAVSGNLLTITPPVSYESSTQYYVEISNGAILSLADVSFPGISSKDTWEFTTDAAAAAPVIAVDGYSPIPGATEVSLNPALELTFTENIVKGNSGYFRIFKSVGGVDEELLAIPTSNGQVSVLNNKLSVTLSNITLEYNTDYYILIDADFVKSATTGVDFGGISSSSEWNFKTETAPPVWAAGYPSVTNQNTIKFDLNAMADVTGTVYAVVTGTPSVPSIEQIVAGQNSSFEPARIARNEVVESIVSHTPVEFLFNDLTLTGKNYYLHTVFENGGKYSTVETIIIDRIIPEINQATSLPVLGYATFDISGSVTIVFTEPVLGFNESGTFPLDISYFSFQYDDEGTPVNVPFVFSETSTSEQTTVVLQPETALLENKEYTISIAPVSDASGNLTEEIVRTFETDKENVWIGGSVNLDNWLDASNWSSGGYVSNKTVKIPYLASGNYPILNETSDYTVFNLIVEPGALLTHTTGSLKVNGVFNLQSSSDYNASYIGGGFLDVSDGIIRIDQVIPNPNGSYLISSPVSGATQSNIGTTGPVMYYDNATDSWNPINTAEEMNGGYGYVTWSNSDLHFSGDINVGNFNVPVIRTDGQGYGWNYVGNPYTASIDWDLLDIDNLKLEDAFWIWDTSNDRYGVYNYETGIHINISSSIIPSNHGFLIKVKNDIFSASLPFSPLAIVPNSSSYIKSSRVKREYEHLKLAGINGDYRDEVAIVFVESAAEGVDKFDSEKLFSGKDKLFQLFTVVGTMKSAINGLPYSNDKEVVLGYSVGVSGEYSIEVVANQLEGKQVFLIDKLLDQTVELTDGGSYSFSVSQKGQNTNRFSLKFVDQISTGEIGKSTTDDFRYYVEDNNIFVLVEEEWIGFSYRIHDINGRTITSAKLFSSGFVNLGEYSTGVYFIEITDRNNVIKIEKIAVY